MLYFTNIFEHKGQIKRKEFIAAGKLAGVPVFNDAAAELPPATNLSNIVHEGFDLVGFKQQRTTDPKAPTHAIL